MAKSLASAQEKWSRKTQNAAGKWAQNTRGAGGEWAKGVAETFGVTPGPNTRAAYESGVAGAEGDYQRGVQGKAQKWATNTARGLSY